MKFQISKSHSGAGISKFKIQNLTPELEFEIQNPLSSGAGISNFKILPELEFEISKSSQLRSWNLKFKIQNLTPELENSKFKISLLRS